MNWKMITRAAFDLTDEEWDQAVKLRALSEPERELLMTALGPQKPAAKKSGKKAGKKSARASGMAIQLSNRRQEQQQPMVLCAHVSDDGDDPTQCGEIESSGIHDSTMGYRNYHPFTPAASSAPPPSDQASSETRKDVDLIRGDDGDVHHAASSGD